MYLPPAFRVDNRDEIRTMVAERGYGHLVTAAEGDGGPALAATPVPFVLRGDEAWSLAGHIARANPLSHCGGAALMIIPGADTYVSPSWYPSKATDGRVVPTWNYEVVHLHGQLVIRDDPTWMLDQVTELTDLHEAAMPTPWSVGNAPDEFIERQLRAIIGVELIVERVEAKRKLSQNRPDADRLGVIAGLATSPARGATQVRTAMDQVDIRP